jgi:putative oxidoreductase
LIAPLAILSTLKEIVMNAFTTTSAQGSIVNTTVNQGNGAFVSTIEVGGRILLAVLFLLAGLSKLGAYSATAAYMASAGIPGALLPLVIATEVLGSLAIILGWKTRVVATLLAGFSLLTALTFHTNFADQTQMIMFLKNVSITGGFLLLIANGAGRYSLDRRLGK